MTPRLITYAHFSGSVLCVSFDVPSAAGPALTRMGLTVMVGGTDENQHAIDARLAANVHEYRHYWDWIGTPLGVALFDCLQRRVNAYLIRLTPHLCRVDHLRVPLLAHLDGAPERVKEFLANYLANMSAYVRLMCHFDLSSDYRSDQAISEYYPPFSREPIPVVRVSDLASERESPIASGDAYIPFGGKHLIECLAFLVERHFLQRMSPRHSSDLLRPMSASEAKWTYTLPLRLVEHRLGRIEPDSVMAMCEFALCTPIGKAAGRETHPGWRFLRLLDELVELGGTAEVDEVANSLVEKDGWTHPTTVMQETLNYAEAQIRHNRNNQERSVVKAYNLIYYELAGRALRHSLEVGFPHRSLRHYFEGRDSDALPLPPIKRLASGERFELLTGDQSDRATTDILLRWHVLESVVDQVATTGELSCAMKSDAMSRTCRLETSRCGRALRFELLQGRPCLYGDTLTSLGLAGS